jgi:hypothetical protein
LGKEYRSWCVSYDYQKKCPLFSIQH